MTSTFSSNVFPILQLPSLMFEICTSFWNPIELVQFSLISKKTEKIARQLKNKCSSKVSLNTTNVYANSCFSIILTFPKTQEDIWYFNVTQKLNGTGKMVFENTEKQELNVYCQDDVSVGLRILKTIVKVFKGSFENLRFKSNWLSAEKLVLVLEYIQNERQVTDLPSVYVIVNNNQFFETFMKHFRQNSKSLEMEGDSILGPAKFNENIEIETLNVSRSATLDMLLSINCIEIQAADSMLTNKDVNIFLQKWQMGESNTKLEHGYYGVNDYVNLKTILKGLSPVVKDPRTTKRCYNRYSRPYWIFGGIDIQRIDGKVCTITATAHGSYKENGTIPRRIIKDFNTAINANWDDETEDFGIEELDADEMHKFAFYIW